MTMTQWIRLCVSYMVMPVKWERGMELPCTVHTVNLTMNIINCWIFRFLIQIIFRECFLKFSVIKTIESMG